MYQECRHIKTNGSKCRAVALKGKCYCQFHFRVHAMMRTSRTALAPYEQREIEMPFLEDRGAIQIALSEVVSAIAGRRIDHKTAALLVYALQVASTNAKNGNDIVAKEQVRDRSENHEGDELAPETITLEPQDEGYLTEDAEPTLAEVLLGPKWREHYESVAKEKREHLEAKARNEHLRLELMSPDLKEEDIDDEGPDPYAFDPEDPDRPIPSWLPGA